MTRTRFQARIDKRANIKQSEDNGIVADSADVRIALMEQVHSGEKTLQEVQTELKKIKRNAKKNGKITRNQAWNRG